MRVSMDLLSMVGELAWLIKDDLHCKHLILSAEEAFIEFLEMHNSGDDTLELDPVASYHRMLLHRLADIFGLVHESVGEGEDRHLVVERSEDSLIPPVLVSDVLKWQYGESQSSQPPCQILKRQLSPDPKHKPIAAQVPSLSFEEREAAYLAARERIFSLDPSNKTEESKEQIKPRNVPVVARRMIAHALGRKLITDPSIQNSGLTKDSEIQCAQKKVSNVVDNLPSSGKKGSTAFKSEQMPAMASRRMLAKYLQIDPSCSDRKGKYSSSDRKPALVSAPDKLVDNEVQYSLRASEASVSGSGLPPNALHMAKGNSKTEENSEVHKQVEYKPGKNRSLKHLSLKGRSLVNSSNVVPQPSKPSDCNPAAAAKRMFTQALGIPLQNGTKAMGAVTARGDGKNRGESHGECSPTCSYLSQSEVCITCKAENVENNEVSFRTDREYEGQCALAGEQPSMSKAIEVSSQKSGTKCMSHSGLNTDLPGKAARRMFAQALGLQNLNSSFIEGNLVRNCTMNYHSTSDSSKAINQGQKSRPTSLPDVDTKPESPISNSLMAREKNANVIADMDQFLSSNSQHCHGVDDTVKNKDVAEFKFSKHTRDVCNHGHRNDSQSYKHENSNSRRLRASLVETSPIASKGSRKHLTR